MNLTHAIVCTPCKNFIYGITTQNLGTPNFGSALTQHTNYINLLKDLGLNITELSSDANHPDSTFIEDTTVFLSSVPILCNPGAKSREGEIILIEKLFKEIFSKIERVESPGTLDGGDVLEVKGHYYIGLSERTNKAGSEQLLKILHTYRKTGSIIPVNEGLHLKSSVSYLGNNHILINSNSIDIDYFSGFNLIETATGEGYSANSISINGTVVLAKGFPQTESQVENAGFSVRTIDVSEFQKIDGGLSCLSLRY